MTHTAHAERVAIITGAALGIGAAVAKRLARDDLAVGVVDLNEAECAGTVKAITSRGGTAAAVAADVADEMAVTAAVSVAQIADALGLARPLLGGRSPGPAPRDRPDLHAAASGVRSLVCTALPVSLQGRFGGQGPRFPIDGQRVMWKVACLSVVPAGTVWT
jgi:NAD(P)-dependent dehydrogenase (short-subunit alcohol dehydrogenase family)